MENNIKKIEEVFTKNDGYVIEKKKRAINQFNILSKNELCLLVEFLNEHIAIHILSKCGINSGTSLLQKIDELAKQIPGIKYIELFDVSTILLNNIKIDLAFYKILTTGQSWYNCFGYVSDNYANEEEENDKLRQQLLTLELIDSCKDKLLTDFIEHLELFEEQIGDKDMFDANNIENNKKQKMVEEKIEQVKKSLVIQFPFIKDGIKIGNFFEYIESNKNLTIKQTQTLKDLIQIISVLIKYNRDLKKTIGNSNNTNLCSIMGGGKIKNKKKPKNNQNETREYGTWKDGSSVYKDKIGYYIYDIKYGIGKDDNGEEYKKYLKNWKPTGILYLDESKRGPGKWSSKKPIVGKKNKTLKYKNRPSPPYPANDWCGKNKKGNNGNMYTSKKNKNGVCRWVKIINL